MNTDKELLIQGIRMMAVFFSILAIVIGFKGLNTVMNSVFGKRKKKLQDN